jgi:hypothetical protein
MLAPAPSLTLVDRKAVAPRSVMARSMTSDESPPIWSPQLTPPRPPKMNAERRSRAQ